MNVDPQRYRYIQRSSDCNGPVIYWMKRDQRVHNNWALLTACQLALKHNQPLAVIFCLMSTFGHAQPAHFKCMLEGLQQTQTQLQAHNIPFVILQGRPHKLLPNFLARYKARTLVTDFSPLKQAQKWLKQVSNATTCSCIEVDTHNIVPAWVASNKQEYAARTIRPKITKQLDHFLTSFPSLKPIKTTFSTPLPSVSWEACMPDVTQASSRLKTPLQAGSSAAEAVLKEFIHTKLNGYSEHKNDPNKDVCSHLSAYLHFGQISSQAIARIIRTADVPKEDTDSFLEELIIRKELADNFCLYNPDYDSPKGYPDWAKQTIHDHSNDNREYLYSLEDFDQAKTHDPLWNAAQIQMSTTGYMHGYMRMYWAKKILEWTPDAGTAHTIALTLNDTYQFDGRDPNGYTGIAWALGGVHDRGWPERSVFGKIRYMNYNGCRRKFDVDAYIKRYTKDDQEEDM